MLGLAFATRLKACKGLRKVLLAWANLRHGGLNELPGVGAGQTTRKNSHFRGNRLNGVPG